MRIHVGHTSLSGSATAEQNPKPWLQHAVPVQSVITFLERARHVLHTCLQKRSNMQLLSQLEHLREALQACAADCLVLTAFHRTKRTRTGGAGLRTQCHQTLMQHAMAPADTEGAEPFTESLARSLPRVWPPTESHLKEAKQMSCNQESWEKGQATCVRISRPAFTAAPASLHHVQIRELQLVLASRWQEKALAQHVSMQLKSATTAKQS